MTRAGEKLHGDWEKRIPPNPDPLVRIVFTLITMVAVSLIVSRILGLVE
jgi:hypothetical protein